MALGCEYDVKPRPSGTYPDPTGFLLTNGKENDNWCSKCNTWCSVGWQDSNPEVELQLVPPGGGGTVAVNRVKIHFSESKGCGIKVTAPPCMHVVPAMYACSARHVCM